LLKTEIYLDKEKIMREKYESLSLSVLKDLAKARGIKGITGLKKGELVERMLEEDERDKAKASGAGQTAGQSTGAGHASAQESGTHNATGTTASAQTSGTSEAHANTAHASGSTDAAPAHRIMVANGTQERRRRPENSSGGRYTTARKGTEERDNRRPESKDREREREAEQAADRSDFDEAMVIKEDVASLDSGISVTGILEVMQDGFGFIRSENYMPGENDVYVSPSQIRRFNLKTGDIITGNTRVKTEKEKFSALLFVTGINGLHPGEGHRRPNFEDLTPIFPNERIRLERPGASVAMRVVDLISPIGKGQRGMIVSQPKAGKTTLLKEIAKSVLFNNPEMHLIILLIDERPEEVTDIKEAIQGDNVEVIYSTFDELPEHHKRVSEMVIERAKRLVEHKKDVIILLDSITRLARAYNLTVPPSGRTLSGGLDPAALHMPKRFFGAARNMREGGSLTVLATALVETGSKMDDVVFEEFKGTGNMELVLDRKLSEKRIFPAIDIVKSGTRREDLLLSDDEQAAVDNMRRAFNGMRSDEAVENILNMFAHTRNNQEFINMVRKNRIL
jgi:transcription termination factor Rho